MCAQQLGEVHGAWFIVHFHLVNIYVFSKCCYVLYLIS